MAKCALPGCNREARRRFCNDKHKDRFHNLTNPRGKFAHLATRDEDEDPEDNYPEGWDGHKNTF